MNMQFILSLTFSAFIAGIAAFVMLYYDVNQFMAGCITAVFFYTTLYDMGKK